MPRKSSKYYVRADVSEVYVPPQYRNLPAGGGGVAVVAPQVETFDHVDEERPLLESGAGDVLTGCGSVGGEGGSGGGPSTS